MKKYVFVALGSGAAGYAGYRYYRKRKEIHMAKDFQKPHSLEWKPETRHRAILDLKDKRFDLLIIGGGASGAGCALDATTRGLRVAMIEYGDFASETSSKSTKLLHGGVRYLEKAFKTLSWAQLKLVLEAVTERGRMLHISPYLTRPLPIMLPLYRYISIPYFFAGLLCYDWVAGYESLGRSFLMSRTKTLACFPALKQEGLKGSVVYYDAQQNDARNNLMIALTSAYYGATALNYVEAVDLIKENGRVVGAKCRDRIGGKTLVVRAKGVINTTGPFTDEVRHKGTESGNMMVPSSGVHIVLPKSFAPNNMGLINPDTTDSRVLFFIPWRGKALIGTTDRKCELEREKIASGVDVNFILNNVRNYIADPKLLTRDKILSTWCGIRPLVREMGSKNTQAIARNHVVHVGKDNLLTLTGGKWTTYRQMAEDAIDKAIQVFHLRPLRGCVTKHVRILGANGYNAHTAQRITNELDVSRFLGQHLNDMYGLRALKLRNYIKGGRLNYLSHKYPFLTQEVEYAVDNEMAVKGHDVLMRRLGLGFIDVKEAGRCVTDVCRILAQKLGWSKRQEMSERKETRKCLKTLGLGSL